MKTTVLPDLHVWSVYQPDRRIDFSGFYWRHPGGGVLIDPMALSEEQTAWLRDAGGVRFILLTNADHLRAAPTLRAEFAAEIWAPEGDRELLNEAEIDGWFGADSALPEPLAGDIDLFWLRGGKTGAEAVFYLRPLRALLFGDAVRSHESGRLRLLPEPKLTDRDALVRDVVALRDLEIDAVLLGDGDSLFTGAAAAYQDLVVRLEN